MFPTKTQRLKTIITPLFPEDSRDNRSLFNICVDFVIHGVGSAANSKFWPWRFRGDIDCDRPELVEKIDFRSILGEI